MTSIMNSLASGGYDPNNSEIGGEYPDFNIQVKVTWDDEDGKQTRYFDDAFCSTDEALQNALAFAWDMLNNRGIIPVVFSEPDCVSYDPATGKPMNDPSPVDVYEPDIQAGFEPIEIDELPF